MGELPETVVRVDLLLPAGFARRPSGGNVYDRRLVCGLGERGWEVHVREVSRPEEVQEALGSVPAGSPVLVDSLTASWAAPVLLGAAARLVPLVHMLFDTPGEREVLADAPSIIVTSQWSRQVLTGPLGLDPRRIHVAVPGVDLAPHAPRCGQAGDLLCVGAVVPAKGQDVLLEALGELADLEWRCTMVGSLTADPAQVETLRKRSADLGVTDRIHLVGELGDEDLALAYRSAGLLVHPSRAESFGMVVTEGLSHRLPVLASAVGGLPEALGEVDGTRPGMLVRPGDPRALALMLRRWLGDERLRRGLRQRVAARLPQLPRWPQTTAVVSRVLEDLR